MIFEPESALLRYLRLGPDEVLRGISAPVRNQFWGTVKPEVTVVSLDQGSDHFTLGFTVACKERETTSREPAEIASITMGGGVDAQWAINARSGT